MNANLFLRHLERQRVEDKVVFLKKKTEIETYGSESRQVVLSLLLLVDLLLQSEERDREIKVNIATPSHRGASLSKR